MSKIVIKLGQIYSPLEVRRIVTRLIFGLYPEIINAPETAATALREIADDDRRS
jgi:hypothetical protein